MSPAILSLSMTKGIVGVGVFALSAGLVSGPGLIPSALIAMLVGVLSCWTYYLLGRATEDTKATDNKSLWTATVGPETAWAYDLATALVCFGGLVQFYSTMTQLVQWLGASAAAAWPATLGGSALASLPYGAALGLVSACMLPLCLLPNLNALKPASAVGFAGILYTVGYVIWRLIDGSYRLPTGAFAATLTGPRTNIWGVKTLGGTAAFLGSISTAFLTHLGVPRFYNELRSPAAKATEAAPAALDGTASEPNVDRAKLSVFAKAVSVAFAVSVGCSTIVMLCGYLIYGDATKSMLFNNFAVTDGAATLVRGATLLSVAALTPILALAFRDAIVPQIVAKGLPLNENLLRVAIALGAHFCSFCFRDVGLIISLRGSLLGAPCVFTMPSLIYLRSKRGKAAGALAKALHRFLMWFGVAMAAVGTTCVLLFR